MSDCNIDVSADKVNKTEIRLAAQNLIRQGWSKQKSFEILKKEYQYSKIISKILRCIPSRAQKQNYRILNYLLLFSLLLPMLLFASQLYYVASLTYVVFIYVVLQMQVRFYIWISAFSLISLVSALTVIFLDNQIFVISIWLMMGANLASLILSIFLEQKLCPKVKQTKEKYIDKLGITRRRIIYNFTE